MIAMLNAEQTSCAAMSAVIAQPTTLREYRSKTTASYSQPLCVRM